MPSPNEFFDAARARFAAAAANAPDAAIEFLMAGHHVRLNFAGTAMRPLLEPVFRHLPRPGTGAAALTIDLWDARTTGVDLLPPPWGSADIGDRGFVRSFCDERFTTRLEMESGALSMIDGHGGTAFQWTPDAARLPHWERAHPLSTVLGRWFRRLDLPMVHAAAIGGPGGAVLLVGRGGTGKSTCTLACVEAGLQTAGDDYLLLDAAGPTVHSLFGSATLHAEHRRRFPRLMPDAEARATADEKFVSLLSVRRPAAMIAALPLVAILAPCVVGHGPCRLRPISPAAALLALAPSTLLQLGQAGDGVLAQLAALCRRLPCHALELGADVAEIPTVVEALLARHAGSARQVGVG
jgi:hypothetical protein